MIISLPIKRYYSKQHFFSVVPTRWRRKPAGIDTERNYVTVTLCLLVTVDAFNRRLGPDYHTERPHLSRARYARVSFMYVLPGAVDAVVFARSRPREGNAHPLTPSFQA